MLGLLLLLLLHLLDVSILQVLLGGLEVGISDLGVFVSLSLDLIEGHADNSLLNLGGSSGPLLLEVKNLGLLVESSGSLGPGKLDGLNSLVVKASFFKN